MRSTQVSRIGSAIGLAAAFSSIYAAPAHADTNPYTPKDVCGSAFVVKDSFLTNGGIGRTYVMRNPTTLNWCVTTLKLTAIGIPTVVGSAVGKYHTDLWDDYDYGNYLYYAGPSRSGRNCVWAGGTNSDGADPFGPGSDWKIKFPYPATCT